VSQAFFDRERRTLTFTIKRCEDRTGDGVVLLSNVTEPAAWTVDHGDLVVSRRGARQKLGGGFELSREGGGLALRCPKRSPHTITVTLEGNGR